MEFAEDHAAAEFIIHSCSAEGVRVNGQDLTESFMLVVVHATPESRKTLLTVKQMLHNSSRCRHGRSLPENH